ncbi:Ornithine decarboxylase [Thelohanellus kitauei]|uniref:Ornithine decarboxylase n=1 Tax=Thelohanellus kitauei TaxID=669202 RepID=A0A0C2J0U9_THEKT|nr:Ornithine decarboxylase [Thelohanellus kitauei]
MQVKYNETPIDVVQHFDFRETVKAHHSALYIDGNADEPFYVCNLGDIVRKHKIWYKKLPRVEPFYAMKCNPNHIIMKMLASLQIGFDCASKAEISQALEVGVPPERIIYANPCKQESYLEFAKLNRVKMMTFDSSHELVKIKNIYPSALLVLRIFVGSSKALCPLGLKFGARTSDIPHLLELAISLNLNVIGVSFHVGSGCFDPQAYSDAIFLAREVFGLAESMGIKMSLLDIGGGFPGNIDTESEIDFFEEVCSTINNCLDTYFPESSSVRIIAEPGRYYVSSAFQLACTVTSIRSNINESGESVYGYFLNDGVYGSFNCTVFDHYIGKHYLLDDVESNNCNEPTFPSVFWGPTCDSIDKILEGFQIKKLAIGDCVVFKCMGAYTMAAGCTFNGFQRAKVKYYTSSSEWNIVAPLFDLGKVEKNVEHVVESDIQVS